MSGTFKLARLFGIDIKLHFSWVFIFFLIAWSLADSYLPQSFPGWTSNTYWLVGIIGSVSLFVCVLIHEFSHSLVAMSRGHKVSSITLFFLGGVSEIEEEATQAGEEFWIAVVGPISSLVLAGIFGFLWQSVSGGKSPAEALFGYLALINLILAIFNMIPAFPMDGGRVLKSLVWKATGSQTKATTFASVTGSFLGFALIAFGIFQAIYLRNFLGGLWLVFIGWFIQSAASSSRSQQTVRTALSGRLVADAMRRELPRIGPGTTVQALVDQHISREFQRAYLVALGDTFQGLVTVSDVRKVEPEDRPQRYVTEIMTRFADLVTIAPETPLEQALELLVSRDVNQLVVMSNGAPAGLLSRGDIVRVLEISQLVSSR